MSDMAGNRIFPDVGANDGLSDAPAFREVTPDGLGGRGEGDTSGGGSAIRAQESRIQPGNA